MEDLSLSSGKWQIMITPVVESGQVGILKCCIRGYTIVFVQSLQNYFITSTFMQFEALELHQDLASVYLSISDSLSRM